MISTYKSDSINFRRKILIEIKCVVVDLFGL